MLRSVRFFLLFHCSSAILQAQVGNLAAANTKLGHPGKDSGRLHQMVDAQGNIQLSIADTILLALENNLDIASARLLKPIAQSDFLRAKAGQLLRNVPTSLSTSPASASGSLTVATSSGYEGINPAAGVLSGLSIQLAGSRIPDTEPVFYASGSYANTNSPEVNPVVAGTNVLTSHIDHWQAGLQKGFMTGTMVDVHLTSLRLSQNAPNNSINPSLTADAEIKIQQPLLQGFSRRVNTRAIHIANNDLKISAMTFQQQVTVTVPRFSRFTTTWSPFEISSM